MDKYLVIFIMNSKGQIDMTKVFSSTEVKARFGTILKLAKDEQVIIEVHGEPEAVLISYSEYQLFEELRESNRRREALKALQEFRGEVTAGIQDLTEEEVYRLAGISEVIAKGIIEKDKEIPSKSL